MNHLAHLFLAPDDLESRLGNLFADFVKGADSVEELPERVQQGVRLHRKIDSFTDSHPIVHRSIGRISTQWGWFSGIILDVYFDYLLIQSWERYTSIDYSMFVESIEAMLESTLESTPAWFDSAMQTMAQRMREYHWLTAYGSLDGIADTLERISERIAVRMPRKAMPLQQAMVDLMAHSDAIADDFSQFFPNLMAFAAAQGGRSDPPPSTTPRLLL